jgi:T5SS/PEP-CTERM-associated repeat protein
MSNVFAFINADGLGDFGYSGNWFDETNPFVPGPPGPTDVALVEASGKINGSASVNTLLYYGDGGLLTSTVQIYAQVFLLEGAVALLGPTYTNISNELEEVGVSTVTMSQGSELYINNSAAGNAGSTATPFDIAVNSSDQSTFNLTGPGTAVILQEGDAIIGDSGIGAMTISSGAELETRNYTEVDTSGKITLGNQTGSQGTLTVTGQSSMLQAIGEVDVGYSGKGSLSVLAGAEVSIVNRPTASNNLFVGDLTGSSGSVLVSGSGSRLTVEGLAIVGYQGTGTLTVANAGYADLDDLVVAYGGGPASVLVEGAGTKLEVTDQFDVGAPGTGSLRITSGAQVVLDTNFIADIGEGSGSNGSISISGAGSIFSSSTGIYNGGVGTIRLGNGGTGSIVISSGGRMITSAPDYIAADVGDGAGKGSVTINGIGSNWTAQGEFDVGRGGNGTLLVDAGGTIETGDSNSSDGLVVGDQTIGVGAAMITGTGSSLTNSGEFVIGMYGSGKLAIASGGVVTTTTNSTDGAVLGEYAGSIGTVSLAGDSTWTISPDLVIGAYGAGSLDINAGSTVSAGSLLMGITGAGYLEVSGTGAKIAVSGNAQFGNSGSASVIINSGGEVSAGGTAALVNGYVSMIGGTLFVSKTLTLDAGQALGGHGTVQASSTINSTTVQAGGGTLSFIGGVTGTGKLEIDVGATLSLGSSVGSGQETIFESATSKLVLGAPASFAGTIYDFIKGDTIDLSKIIASSLTYSGQTLTVHESSGASLALKFFGTYTQSSFGMTSDGHSGTFITHT